MANVKYKIEAKGERAIKGDAEIIISAALNGEDLKVCVVGNAKETDVIRMLSHLVSDIASYTGKGVEFVQLVSTGATLQLIGGDDSEGE